MSFPPSVNSQLFAAAQAGDTHVVAALLRAGAEPCAIDAASGWTALSASILAGHARVAEALIDAGADVRTVDQRGNSALHACAAGAIAVEGDQVGIALARRVLEQDSSVDAVGAHNHEGVTPLHLAAQRGKRALLKLLAEFGAPLCAKDRAGRDACKPTLSSVEGALRTPPAPALFIAWSQHNKSSLISTRTWHIASRVQTTTAATRLPKVYYCG